MKEMTSMDWLRKIGMLFRSQEYAQTETLAAGSYPPCSNPREFPAKWRRNLGKGTGIRRNFTRT